MRYRHVNKNLTECKEVYCGTKRRLVVCIQRIDNRKPFVSDLETEADTNG